MEIVFKQQPYIITVQNKAGFSTVNLLKRTQWGTAETVYQHQHTEQNIDRVPGPLFFNLQKEQTLIGTCCFSKRNTAVHGERYDVWYARYFSIETGKQGNIFGNMMMKHIRSYFEKQIQYPAVFYAYVDAANIRSSKLVQHTGFKTIRNFETLTFSRLYPKTNKNVSLILQQDKDTMRVLLETAYQDHVFAHFDTAFFDENYFVFKKDNVIVAGIRLHMAHWIIRSLGGWAGTVLIKLLPHLPVLSRLFNPDAFRFAAFDGIYSKAGYETEFFALMESVCARVDRSIGIMWLDADSALYKRLKHAGDWGIINKLKKNIPAHIVASFKNISQETQEKITACPAYISAVDII